MSSNILGGWVNAIDFHFTHLMMELVLYDYSVEMVRVNLNLNKI